MRIEIKTIVDGNYKEVFARFDKALFVALKPPVINLDLERFDGCAKGDKVEMSLGLLGIKQAWKSLIVEDGVTDEEVYFIDEGVLLPPPLKDWRHRHILKNIDNTQTEIIDDIQYSSGIKLLDLLMYPIMYMQFWLRKPIYKQYFSKK